MKVNNLLLTIALVSASLSMHARAPEVILQTIRAEGQPMLLKVRTSHPAEIAIDWGDGRNVTYQALETTTEINGLVCGRFIKIRCADLTFLDCVGCDIVDLDVSKAKDLVQLYCGKNHLEAIDLTGNPSLEMFGCPNNQISYLSFRNNRRLKGLYLQNNRFGSVVINDIFRTIPSRVSTSSNVNLRITGNPGARDANTQMAVDKNWTVDTQGSGKGGYPVIIETLKQDGSECKLELRLDETGPAIIDWGKGKVTVQVDTKTTVVKGRVYGNYIKIWADNLTFLKCERMAISDIDISHCESLQQIYCGYNELEALDVTHNPKLVRFGCNDNHLASLDISKNKKLVGGLYLQNNNFGKKALNTIFRQLIGKKTMPDQINLRITGNPGADKSNVSLAQDKNWHVDILSK